MDRLSDAQIGLYTGYAETNLDGMVSDVAKRTKKVTEHLAKVKAEVAARKADKEGDEPAPDPELPPEEEPTDPPVEDEEPEEPPVDEEPTEPPVDEEPDEEPALTAPVATISIVGESPDRVDIRLAWEPVEGAEGYAVRAKRLNGDGRTEVTQSVPATTLQITHTRTREAELSPYQMCVLAVRGGEPGPETCEVADILPLGVTEPEEPPVDDEPPVDEEPAPVPEPLPPTNLTPIWKRDMRLVTLAEVSGGGDWKEQPKQPTRIAFDKTRGMRYDFPARTSCRDYSISTYPEFGRVYRQIFLRAVMRWSPHWNNIVPACEKAINPEGSNPDWKAMMLRVWNFGSGGAARFGLLIGNGYKRHICYDFPFEESGTYHRFYRGGDAQLLWDGEEHEVTLFGLCSSALNVPDGGGGIWIDGVLKKFAGTGYVVNRRGIYGAVLGANINQGPLKEQSVWFRHVEVYTEIPAEYATA